MKKTLEKIRSKSPETRMLIAFILALTCTAIVGAGWFMTLSGGDYKITPDVPSPFTTLGGAVKDIIAKPNTSNTEIIDATGSDTAHDESNPYQTPATTTTQ